MDTQIIVVFCLCDDMLKSLRHCEDPQCQTSDAEVMTTAIVAMLFFKGNFALAGRFLFEKGHMPIMLGASRFNRRLHRIADLFLTLFLRPGETWKKLNERSAYVIDSCPIAVCDNYCIKRSKVYQGETFRGYSASKKRYFYGLRIHLLVTEHGEPVELFLGRVSSVIPAHSACTTLIFQKARLSRATKPTTITQSKMLRVRPGSNSHLYERSIRFIRYLVI